MVLARFQLQTVSQCAFPCIHPVGLTLVDASVIHRVGAFISMVLT